MTQDHPADGRPDQAAGAATPASPLGDDPRQAAAAYLRLIGVAALVGIPAAALAAVFLAVVHTLEDWLWTDLPDALGHSSPPAFLVIGLPVAGAGLVLIARKWLPGDGGHSPLQGIGMAATPWQHAPGIALAALGTLAFGAVLGPEAPLIALGSVVGMVAVGWFKTEGPGREVLATAGSFSAISALFGGPLVAGVLLLESAVGLGSMALPALLPGLVAAAVGYVLFVGLGDWAGISTQGLTVPNLPVYDGTHVVDLALAVVVGVVTSLVIAAVRRAAGRIDRATTGNLALGLLCGGLAIGLLAWVASLLGASSQDVLFSGQESVPAEVAETSLSALLILVVAKALAYAVSLGAGFRGGPVFPAIFLGVGVASIAVVAFDSSPTWAIAVGAAAGMAGGTKLVFSAILFSTLLVGSAGGDAISAAVLAAAAAWLTAMAVERRQSAMAGPPDADPQVSGPAAAPAS